MWNVFFFGEDAEPVKCPEGWLPYAGHCYVIHREPRAWKDALMSCNESNGNLASIHNSEEHAFILSQLGYSEFFSGMMFGRNGKLYHNFYKVSYLFYMNMYREAHRYRAKKKNPNHNNKPTETRVIFSTFIFHGFHFDLHLFFTAWKHLKEITTLVPGVFGLIICLRRSVATDSFIIKSPLYSKESHFLLLSHFLASWKKNVH